MFSDLRNNLSENFRSGRIDLNAGVASIGAALADPHFENFELRPQADNQIENFGEKKRIDDVAGDLYNAARHRDEFYRR